MFETLTFKARAARALLHLSVMIFIAAMLISVCNWFRLNDNVTQIVNFMQENCGGIEMTKSGLRTVLEPEKAKSGLATPDLEFRYTPSAKITVGDINLYKDAGSGVIWSPGIIALWIRTDARQYTYLPIIYHPAKTKIPTATFSASELAETLTQVGNSSGPFNLKFERQNITIFQLPLAVGTAVVLFIINYLYIGFHALVFSLIFSLIFGFTGKRTLRDMPWRRLFAIVIYASFPPILIGAFFPALDIQGFFDYQTVFLFCYVCYLMPVLVRVEKTIYAKKMENDAKSS